jgi:hypothetical protein
VIPAFAPLALRRGKADSPAFAPLALRCGTRIDVRHVVRFLAGITMVTMMMGAGGAAVVAGQASTAAKAGQPALSVTCSIEGKAGTFHVSVTNPGDRDIAILMGFTPGAPQPQVVNAVSVAVIRIATGATEDYLYVNPKYAIYAGRKDPWIVPLKAGGSYQFDLPLKDFISSMNYNSLEPVTAMGGRLVLEGRVAPNSSASLWTGKIDTTIEACG